MRYLLDTHVLLWWLADHPKLSARHRALIADPRNAVFASSIAVAEISIKASLGKIDAPDDLIAATRSSGLDFLAFDEGAAERLRHLPWHHRDPFDRMLIAQAMAGGLTLLSADERVALYDLPIA